VTRFPKQENAVYYESSVKHAAPTQADTLLIMTWNIRFGAARLPWFGDSCGDRVILTGPEVENNMDGVCLKINEIDPDILTMQEADVNSKRTDYMDEVQYILDNTNLNYAVYASMWEAQYVPSDGLGRVNTGNVVFSKWKISDATRIQLPLRNDQDALTKYFYLRRNILKTKVAIPNHDDFHVVVVHASAFSTDDTKERQFNVLVDELNKINDAGGKLVMGGDLNELPPGTDSTNYCAEDWCPGDEPGSCREGSDYTSENTWLQGLYDAYTPAIALNRYLQNNQHFFTHSTSGLEFWNRKLDYLFTNQQWVAGSDSTHQEAMQLADHAPVTARLVVSP